MPLVSIGKEMKRAQAGGYALPLFDTSDVQSTEGMIRALEARRAPAMVALYSGALERPNGRAMAAYVRIRAEQASVPISLMLDHGSSFENVMHAISAGFTDVMYDGSSLPLDENIAQTKAVVRAGHALGIWVEAELGHVGSGRDYQSFGALRKGFTDPDTVERFVAETGVDMLAIAIGTAHGLYAGDPELDLDLLRDIRQRVDIPLVLHGGSGCSDAQFRATIENGISKINVATDLFRAAGAAMSGAATGGEASYWGFSRVATEAFEERVGYYADLFGASGQA
ncbi:MAG: class II fructose-bisphosphate aldolase [Anaerolineae bacterium]|nr:class II fructose-bisphosphate aldolase [Anaerolineae bacterium]